MKLRVSTMMAGLAMLALAAGAWALQRGGGDSARAEATAPSPAAEMVVAGLGGFRGIAAEVVWFRADRLQDEGRYAELAQLATWLTFMEPYTPEVWAFAAWNLAYNVSVMMPTAPDRWRWVDAGMRLLRDDGLRLNPGNPVLFKEFAWMFLHKLGGHLDEASPYYREQWRRIYEERLKEGRLEEIGMKRALMDEIDAEYGRQEWSSPLASALYWGVRGMKAVGKDDEYRAELRQVVFQALMMEANADSAFAPRALKEMRDAYVERPSPQLRQLILQFKARYQLN